MSRLECGARKAASLLRRRAVSRRVCCAEGDKAADQATLGGDKSASAVQEGDKARSLLCRKADRRRVRRYVEYGLLWSVQCRPLRQHQQYSAGFLRITGQQKLPQPLLHGGARSDRLGESLDRCQLYPSLFMGFRL
ncbi:hypothetical protein KDC22_11235 [Paenibacillus tritici]|uniref:hypothetical protein n=1 Tax=Paenibacillus tritici TaxID=1873425 RepID=UPI001BA7BDCA|nr:hypothetical protein [Paenibacillus tritici]QUL56994.1 hypothetical protein KDC22_11235 [Paenibacillus tritici]